MKLIGIMPVRNEDWCLGLSARVALRWCDALVIGMHACTDRSWDIVHELVGEESERITWINLGDGEWQEMGHRNILLETARSEGATHIALIDADEVLAGTLIPYMEGSGIAEYPVLLSARGHLEDIKPGQILQLPLYNLRGSLDRYHNNGIWGNRWVSVAFADSPELHWTGDRFHHREPMGRHLIPYRPIAQGQGGVMHLWGADERRLRAHHAWYKVTERLRWPERRVIDIEQMYSWAIKGIIPTQLASSWTFADVPPEWWAPYADLMHDLHLPSAEGTFQEALYRIPWQEAEVRRLVSEHGAEMFVGLDLFGVV